MVPLAPNPETGFLETQGAYVFDSMRKVKFLELSRQCIDQGKWPNITAILESMHVSYRTFSTHLDCDEKFKAAWQEIVMSAANSLESKMFEYAQNKSGYMHMITWLRKNVPNQWNPDQRVIVSADAPVVKGVIDAASGAIEAEIVAAPTVIETPAASTPVIRPSGSPK